MYKCCIASSYNTLNKVAFRSTGQISQINICAKDVYSKSKQIYRYTPFWCSPCQKEVCIIPSQGIGSSLLVSLLVAELQRKKYILLIIFVVCLHKSFINFYPTGLLAKVAICVCVFVSGPLHPSQVAEISKLLTLIPYTYQNKDHQRMMVDPKLMIVQN